jgi:serine/threonine protein phosphatase PrpC
LDEEQIKILVFGTDGVWKFLTNDKIMDIVLPYYLQNDAEGATQKIKETANNLWNIKNPKGIADITVFVLFFK